MRLLLVRHGESEWNAAGRLQGQADPPLSKRGRSQAARVAARLSDEAIDVIVSSDLQRAVDTAAPLATILGLTVEGRADLREVDLGSWTGISREQVERDEPELWRRWYDEGVEGWEEGETYRQAIVRIGGAISEIARTHSGKRVVAVSHGGSIRLAACHLLGLPADQFVRIMSIGNASITEFQVEPDGSGRVVRLNDNAHLMSPTATDDLEPTGTAEFEAQLPSAP